MQAALSSTICTIALMTLAASSVTWYVSLQHQFVQELRQAQLGELAESLSLACVELVSVARSSARQELLIKQRLELPRLPQGYSCKLLMSEYASVPKSYSLSVLIESEGEPYIKVSVDVPFGQKHTYNILVLNDGVVGDIMVMGRLESGSGRPYIFVKKVGDTFYLGLGVMNGGA